MRPKPCLRAATPVGVHATRRHERHEEARLRPNDRWIWSPILLTGLAFPLGRFRVSRSSIGRKQPGAVEAAGNGPTSTGAGSGRALNGQFAAARWASVRNNAGGPSHLEIGRMVSTPSSASPSLVVPPVGIEEIHNLVSGCCRRLGDQDPGGAPPPPPSLGPRRPAEQTAGQQESHRGRRMPVPDSGDVRCSVVIDATLRPSRADPLLARYVALPADRKQLLRLKTLIYFPDREARISGMRASGQVARARR